MRTFMYCLAPVYNFSPNRQGIGLTFTVWMNQWLMMESYKACFLSIDCLQNLNFSSQTVILLRWEKVGFRLKWSVISKKNRSQDDCGYE